MKRLFAVLSVATVASAALIAQAPPAGQTPPPAQPPAQQQQQRPPQPPLGANEWRIDDKALWKMAEEGWTIVRTSAKTGEGVEDAFLKLAKKVVTT